MATMGPNAQTPINSSLVAMFGGLALQQGGTQMALLPKDDGATAKIAIDRDIHLIDNLTILLNPESFEFLRALSKVDIDITAHNPHLTTSSMFFIGTVFHVADQTPDHIRKMVPEGAVIQIKTCIPPDTVTSETIRFPQLEIRVQTDPELGPSYDFTDPRTPCAIFGTREFAERARVATLNSCGKSAAMPCETCTCAGPRPIRLDFII